VTASYEPANQYDMSILALNPANGTVKWQYHEDTYMPFATSCTSNYVLVTMGWNTGPVGIYPELLLDANTGHIASSWTPIPNEGSPQSGASACIDTHGNFVFFATTWGLNWFEIVTMDTGGDGRVFAGPITGPVTSVFNAAYLSSANNGNIYYLVGFTSPTTMALTAYDAQGNQLWSYPITSPDAPLVGADGSVYVDSLGTTTIYKFASSASPNTARQAKG
jgi:hypothetical protein